MAGFFDSIGRLDENDPTLQGYNVEDSKQGQVLDSLYPREFDSNSEGGMHLPSKSQQRDALNSGLVRVGDSDKFVTPSLLLAGAKDQDTKTRMINAEEKYKEIRNSVGFRFADTLADTGRAFLSPLFWLGGEDTTRYDPSAKLEAGYRQQFAAAEGMRTAVYQAADAQRQTRAAYLEQLNQNRVVTAQNQRNYGLSQRNYDLSVSKFNLDTVKNNRDALTAGLTEDDKRFRNYYNGIAGNGAYEALRQNPEQYQSVFEDYNTDITGKLVRIQPVGEMPSVTMPTKRYEEIDKLSARYDASGFRDAVATHAKLVGALDVNNPVGDIAAVFTFMKALDPTSVVRESEFAVVAGAGGIMDKIKQIEAKYKTGDFLPPEVKASLREYADQLMQINMASYDAGRSSALNKLGRFGVTEQNGLAQRFLGNDVFSRERPQPEVPQMSAPPVGTLDDGTDYYEDELGTYILNPDGTKVHGDIQ
tara:strand:+ start:5707 stop:7131 length:1425 start_codon:yes stop_codon:yes gene_type:complete